MEELPRELLREITKRLSLINAACLAQTNKSFNNLIWSLVTTLNEEDSKKIGESTRLDRFSHLEALLFGYSVTIVPRDLSKLTTLQKLKVNTAIPVLLQNLTNLRELNVYRRLSGNLGDHTRLTRLEVTTDDIHQLDPFSWKIMTRLRLLSLTMDYPSPKFSAGYFSPLWGLTQLRGLGLSSIILDQPKPESGLSKLVNLEELDIYGCRLKDDDSGEWMIDYNELIDLKKLTMLSIMDVKMNEKLIDIVANMTQLLKLYLYEHEDEYQLSVYSNLKNLTAIWFGYEIVESDPSLDFTQMPNFEVVSIPWCPNVTQLVHLKNLRELFLRKGGSQNDDQKLNFLNGLQTLRELTLSAVLLPSDGIVDMKGMTNLMYLEISMFEYNIKPALHNFLRGLAVVPLVSLEISDVNQELFQVIVKSLTQLRTLKLPKKGRDLFNEGDAKDSTMPSRKDFKFRIEFREY